MSLSLTHYTRRCATSGQLVNGYGPTFANGASDTSPIGWVDVHEDGSSHALDGSHVYVPNSIKTVETASINKFVLETESVATEGRYQQYQIKIQALRNSTTVAWISWPFRVSPLICKFLTDEVHRGDDITMTVGDGTAIGGLTQNCSPSALWLSQNNYVVGDTVEYEYDPTNDPNVMRCYTCKLATTESHELPTHKTYWRHGYKFSISPSVLQYAFIGHELTITDGTHMDRLGRVLKKDLVQNYIWTEFSPTHTYAYTTPTQVQISVVPIKQITITSPWEYSIGEEMNAGTTVPTDVKVYIAYTNKSLDTDKFFVGRVGYLYGKNDDVE